MPAEAGRRSSLWRGRASRGRLLARVSLSVTVPLLAALILLGPAVGPGIVLAQATTSPSPSPTGAGEPSIAFLNPAASYDPQTIKPPRPPADPTDPTGTPSPDRPKVSDRFDGVDRAYHITAAVANVPPNPIVEVYILRGAANSVEETISIMDRVPGTDTWGYNWDIPESFPEGNATMIVRLYTQTPAGIEQVAEHEVLVEMQHRGEEGTNPPDRPAEETVEITWPSNGGPLGFYKPKGGQWRTVIDGFASSRTENFDVLYTTTPPGQEPEYVICAQDVSLFNTPEYDAPGGSIEIPFSAPCTLATGDEGLDVTAVAIVTLETDLPDRDESGTGRPEQTQDSADAHRVDPYVQDPSSMKISIDPQTTGAHTSIRRRTAGATSGAGGGCLAFLATVTDELDRRVQGANVDVHLKGPSDQMFFGNETSADQGTSGGFGTPEKEHASEPGKSCDTIGNNNNTQAEHNVPGGNDIKHRESTTGTGVASGDQPFGVPPLVGQWRFHLHSPTAGITEILAWVDNEPQPDPDTAPESDDDLPGPTEPSATNFAQWYSSAPTVDIVPAGGSAQAGGCARYMATVRSGAAAVREINIDIHAQGPDDQLDFCDPADATPRRAPDRGPAPTASPHEAEDPGESSHAQASPRAQHTEGETDQQGNFVFGITSPVTGQTTITAWADGEKFFYDTQARRSSDNDILGSGEPSRVVGHSWTASAADATVRFVNPSGYGGGDEISTTQDADATYHLVARSDGAGLIPGIEFLYSLDGTTFTSIGFGTRVGESDSYELSWAIPASLEDDSYTLRAQIIGTSKIEDRTVTLTADAETAEITRPLNGSAVPFTKNATIVAGLASAGAEKVQFYYTKAAANTLHDSAVWILCGNQTLNGGGSAPQSFSGACTLVTPDQPSQVTGIAAITIDCDADFGCPEDTPPPLGAQAPEAGDAHRVFGFDANPIVSIEPAEQEAKKGECARFELRVVDQNGQPIPNQNVDVHLVGPNDSAAFCDPSDGSPRTNPGDGSHAASPDDPQTGFHEDPAGADVKHTEGTSGSSGRFIFGVTSPDEGDSQITGWADQIENDVLDESESRDTATMHWVAVTEPSGKCTIRGTSGDDVLRGTRGRDVICGRGGNDVISGRGGNDLLRGGRGADTLRGGRGSDVLRGGRGKDRLFGGKGSDTIRGGRGNDRINGGPGIDDCVGGPGRDRVRKCE